MLTRSQAKTFFVGGTVVVSAVFIWMTYDTFQKIPELTRSHAMSEEVVRGKHLFDESNCMGCHTILGEGGYYAPELTKVYERRGPQFIRAMLRNPQEMYPGQRKMEQYDFTEEEIDAFVAFFKWIGKMDLNGFPPEPTLVETTTPTDKPDEAVASREGRPAVFNQMCVSCHSLGGQGGNVGPALDGVGNRMTQSEIETWLKDPKEVRPGTAMPDLPLSTPQVRELAAFLSQQEG
jgi:nitric oxide reductase subunit C